MLKDLFVKKKDNLIGFDVINPVPERYFRDRIKRPGSFLSFRIKNKFPFELRKKTNSFRLVFKKYCICFDKVLPRAY